MNPGTTKNNWKKRDRYEKNPGRLPPWSSEGLGGLDQLYEHILGWHNIGWKLFEYNLISSLTGV